ncbi:MAG: hypothetical protein D6731_07640 [Planctomycetota bacterium]|nr:MAG: hypothetical protein D6731_07640 [Planctomycetota bacterium]
MVGRQLPSVPLFALALLLAAPAVAQPSDDPFEAIVSNPDGATARLNDVALPVRNPTESELRQYLEAFRVINLSANLRVDPAVKKGHVGPFSLPGGTRVTFRAEYTKRPGEPEAILRTLELVPSNPMSLGPLKFHRMTLDRHGVLRFHLNLSLMGLDFWPQELTIEKIYRDRAGNMVFKTGGSGLAGAFGPDLRITPTGKVQRYSKGFLGLFGRGWKDVTEDGAVPTSFTLKRWPPGATDLVDWFRGAPPPEAYPTGNTSPTELAVLDAIPIKDLSLRFTAEADPKRIVLSDGGGYLDLSNHRIDYEANGRFEGRAYVDDPSRRNAYELTAHVSGEVHRPGLPRARIDGVDVRLSGEHSGRIPFDRPEDLSVTAGLRAEVAGEVSDLRLEQPGGVTVHAPGSVHLEADAAGELVLRPFTGNPEDRKELVVDRDSRYRFWTDGPVRVEGADALGGELVRLPKRISLAAADDPTTPEDEGARPVLRGEGDLGARMGMVFTRTNLRLEGETAHGGAVAVLARTSEEPTLRATLLPGARLRVRTHSFAGLREGDLLSGRRAGGVRVTADASVRGRVEDAHVEAAGNAIDLPGETELEARVAANVRYGTRNGAETEVRSLAASADLALREGEGRIDAGLPGRPRVRARLAPGTRLSLNTGLLRRASPRGSLLETEGYERGERAASLRAQLVIEAGSLAHRRLVLGLAGRTRLDLTASLGLRLDPKDPAAAARHPVRAGLDLSLSFAAGTRFTLTREGVARAEATLRGPLEATLSAEATVSGEGVTTLESLGTDVEITAEAVDLKALLTSSLGHEATASLEGRSSLRLRQVRVSFDEDGGLRLEHGGATIELGAGSLVLAR